MKKLLEGAVCETAAIITAHVIVGIDYNDVIDRHYLW
jgi:hypothetical protein